MIVVMANLIDVIKADENNGKIIWKSDIEDFNTGTQLIVHESQEAVFFMNGQALDLFGPGKYTLETQNMPLLNKFFNKSSGDKTPYHCQVYFIDKTEQMAIKWGTDSKVQYMEPKYKFPLQIGACGEMTYVVGDSRKLLIKVVGTEKDIDNNTLSNKLKAFVMAKVKPYLAEILQKGDYSIFEVDSHMLEISENMYSKLVDDFNEYGLSLKHFFVTTIAKPDGDEIYERYKKIHINQYADIVEANIKKQVGVIESEEIAQKRETEGYNYHQERSYNIAEKVAENEGVGNFSNMGIGLGVMNTVANNVGGTLNNSIEEIPKNSNKDDDIEEFKRKIEKLKALKEANIITEEEFEAQKKKLLENI